MVHISKANTWSKQWCRLVVVSCSQSADLAERHFKPERQFPWLMNKISCCGSSVLALMNLAYASALTSHDPDNTFIPISEAYRLFALALHWSKASCSLWANPCCTWAHFDSRTSLNAQWKTTSAAFIGTSSLSLSLLLTPRFWFCSFIIRVDWCRGPHQCVVPSSTV